MNAKMLSFDNCLNKLKLTTNRWENMKLNIFNKVTVIKVFIASKLQYILKLYPLDYATLQKFNNLLFSFLWSSTNEKLPRDILMCHVLDGGLSMPNLLLRSQTDQLQTLLNIRTYINQPWAGLFIYWFGFSLNDIYPSLCSNNFVHTINIPKELSHFSKL